MMCLLWHTSWIVSEMTVRDDQCLMFNILQEICKYTSIMIGTDETNMVFNSKKLDTWGSFKSDVTSCCARAVEVCADSYFFYCMCFVVHLIPSLYYLSINSFSRWPRSFLYLSRYQRGHFMSVIIVFIGCILLTLDQICI